MLSKPALLSGYALSSTQVHVDLQNLFFSETGPAAMPAPGALSTAFCGGILPEGAGPSRQSFCETTFMSGGLAHLVF